MATAIAASAVRTCLGDGARTFAALLAGRHGAGPLRCGDPERLGVSVGYHVAGDDTAEPGRVARLLTACLRDLLARRSLEPAGARVVVVVGTGLGGLPGVEAWALNGTPFAAAGLHFADAVAAAVPTADDVVTVSNACSASGHALALAQDLVECGEADAAIACGVDVLTESMLTMIGKVAAGPTDRVRPFDRDRSGVLLGEAAAAVLVTREEAGRPALARLLATGLSCDAHHETAPDVDGICRAMRDAFARADREPATVDVVVAHGTGTALNDPAECAALRKVLRAGGGDPLVTAVKGATGHTSGAASLVNVDVAVRCLATGTVPSVTGLRTVLDEGDDLRFVVGRPAPATPRVVQVNAFGFGGVNAVSLLEAA